MQYLKVPHAVFALNLCPTDLKVYLYLLKCQNTLGTATVRLRTICEQCAIASVTTVRAALRRLESRGLAAQRHRYGQDGRLLCSSYAVQQLGGCWFKLWLGVRPFSLDKSAFAVYLYLCRQRVCYSGKACPSQNVIAAALGIARRTVCDAVARLTELGAVIKGKFWRGKHNLYWIMQTVSEVWAKKETPLSNPAVTATETKARSKAFNAITTIMRLLLFVKIFLLHSLDFLFGEGCAIFDTQFLDLTFNPKKEKKDSTRIVSNGI